MPSTRFTFEFATSVPGAPNLVDAVFNVSVMQKIDAMGPEFYTYAPGAAKNLELQKSKALEVEQPAVAQAKAAEQTQTTTPVNPLAAVMEGYTSIQPTVSTGISAISDAKAAEKSGNNLG